MKKAVLFDCDGVLVNTESIGYQTMTVIFNRHGLNYSPEERARKLTGRSSEDMRRQLEDDYKKRHGKSLPDSFFESARTAYFSNVQKFMRAVPGASECIRTLAAAGIDMAVASNGDEQALRRKLKRVEMTSAFRPHIYSKDCVSWPKPAPDLYLHAMKGLAVRPQDCIVIEDSPVGILAAKAAGAYVIGFTGDHKMPDIMGKQHRQAGADETYRSMADITRRLRTLLGLSGPKPGAARANSR